MAVTRIETQDLAVARGGCVVLEGVDLRVQLAAVGAGLTAPGERIRVPG